MCSAPVRLGVAGLRHHPADFGKREAEPLRLEQKRETFAFGGPVEPHRAAADRLQQTLGFV